MSRLLISRIARAFGLLGLALLVAGLFLPYITSVDLFSSEPVTQILSVWGLAGLYSALFLIGPVALVVLSQFMPMPGGPFSVWRRIAFIACLVCAIGGLLLFLLVTRAIYCLGYCGATGPWSIHGFRMLDPGFWLMLAGFVLSILSSLVPRALRQSPMLTGEGAVSQVS